MYSYISEFFFIYLFQSHVHLPSSPTTVKDILCFKRLLHMLPVVVTPSHTGSEQTFIHVKARISLAGNCLLQAKFFDTFWWSHGLRLPRPSENGKKLQASQLFWLEFTHSLYKLRETSPVNATEGTPYPIWQWIWQMGSKSRLTRTWCTSKFTHLWQKGTM